jgi:putative transposase
MSGTFSQIYIHIIFAVKGRENLISGRWREELYKYIAGIIRNKEQKPVIVGGMSDHIHILVGLRPAMTISDLVRDIKNNSSKFINERKLVNGRFSWQEGYGVFSYSHSDVETVYNYILNQESHHHRTTFKEEYSDLLKAYEIKYDDKYLFDWIH